MIDTKPAVFIRLNLASKINHRTHNPNAFKLYVSVLPENKGTLSQLKGTESLTSEVTWSFRFENPEKSNILFELHEYIPQDEKVGRLVLPLKWFRPNTVCRETYPMKPTNKNQDPMLIDLTVHYSNNGDGPFQAPEATLTVTPAWNKQQTPTVIAQAPQIVKPTQHVEPTATNIQPSPDPYQLQTPTETAPISLAVPVPPAPVHPAAKPVVQVHQPPQTNTPNVQVQIPVPNQILIQQRPPMYLPYPPLPGIPPILGFVPGFQLPPPPQPFSPYPQPMFVPQPVYIPQQMAPAPTAPIATIAPIAPTAAPIAQPRNLPRDVVAVQRREERHVAVESYSQPAPERREASSAPRAKGGAEEIGRARAGGQLELDDAESPMGAVGEGGGMLAPLEVGDEVKRGSVDSSVREKLLE